MSDEERTDLLARLEMIAFLVMRMKAEIEAIASSQDRSGT